MTRNQLFCPELNSQLFHAVHGHELRFLLVPNGVYFYYDGGENSGKLKGRAKTTAFCAKECTLKVNPFCLLNVIYSLNVAY